jgi:rhamnulokinase
MRSTASFLGVDLGASSGRVIASHWDGTRFQLQEVHRFANGGVCVGDRMHWDVLQLWGQVLQGLSRFGAMYGKCPNAVGIDAWGIDFGLLDSQGHLIGNPVHYRDRRTEGMTDRLSSIIDETALFAETGVQSWHINTLFQLYSMVLADDPHLRIAARLLTIPDLFSYFLTGVANIEFTQATTTQMFAPLRGDWVREVIRRAGIPERILPEIVRPCTPLGNIRPAILAECSFHQDVPVIAVTSHDTAAAVAAVPDMDDHSAFISSGTWSLMGTEIPEPNCSEEARRRGFTNEGSGNGKFLLLRNLAGLWIMQECLRCWEKTGKIYSWRDVIESASAAAPFRTLLDPDDAVFETSVNMPQTIQDYCRRTGQPVPESAGEHARALFEGLALSYRAVLVSLESLTGKPLHTIRIVGGGSQNTLLSQMVADACQRRVVSGPAEATALGNVMAQAIATGHLADFEEGRRAIADSYEFRQYEPRLTAGWEEAPTHFEALRRRQSVDYRAGQLALY